jgi:hypothetical protein
MNLDKLVLGAYALKLINNPWYSKSMLIN